MSKKVDTLLKRILSGITIVTFLSSGMLGIYKLGAYSERVNNSIDKNTKSAIKVTKAVNELDKTFKDFEKNFDKRMTSLEDKFDNYISKDIPDKAIANNK